LARACAAAFVKHVCIFIFFLELPLLYPLNILLIAEPKVYDDDDDDDDDDDWAY